MSLVSTKKGPSLWQMFLVGFHLTLLLNLTLTTYWKKEAKKVDANWALFGRSRSGIGVVALLTIVVSNSEMQIR